MSDCFDPLKDELGTVPTALYNSKYVTACMLGICETYTQSCNISSRQKIAFIVDAVFEEVFRAEATNVLKQVDQWHNSQDSEFTEAYHQAKSRTANNPDLDIDWLKQYSVENFEPSTNLML